MIANGIRWSMIFALVALNHFAGAVEISGYAGAKGNRFALVIGNGAYKSGPLKNPVNDARAVAKEFRKLGFDVTTLENQNREGLLKSVRDFSSLRRKPNAVNIVFYAGHGVQFKGKNYLIPVDPDFTSESDVGPQSLDLDYVLEKLSADESAANILVLDACRNNPFGRGSRNISVGLAAIEAAAGTYIAFATAPGSVASDGAGENGVYTKHLIKHIADPGIPIEQMFKRVLKGVLNETQKLQVPWTNSSLTSDLYLNPASGTALTPSSTSVQNNEASDWAELTKDSGLYDLVAFLKRYPATQHRDELLGRVNAFLTRIGAPKITSTEMDLLTREAAGGYQFRMLTPSEAAYRGLADGVAPVVTTIQKGSPADKAGGKVGDILYSINGRRIDSIATAYEIAHEMRPGSLAEVIVIRNKQRLSLQAVAERASLGLLLSYVAQERAKAKDPTGAMEVIGYLARQGDSSAVTQMGHAYLSGNFGKPKDVAQAASYFRKAADAGYLPAIYTLAQMTEKGLGTEKNITKAFELYNQAAEDGFPEAAAVVGAYYLFGGSVAVNLELARKWLEIGAEQGVVSAQYLMGGLYEEGKAVPKDASKAADWFRRAFDNATAEAGRSNYMQHFWLGLMYESGRGAKQDVEIAKRIYREAGKRGDERAIRRLAVLEK